MIDVLEDAFQERGLLVKRQAPSREGRATGYIDLLISDSDLRLLVVEIEMEHKRTANDIRKRDDLGDRAVLWIVTPTAELAATIRKHLRGLGIQENERLLILPFGKAVKQVLTKDPFCFKA
jgi:hypothetical protein